MQLAIRFVGALVLTCASVSAQCNLATLYATNNGGNVGGAVYFDIIVTNPIRVTGFDVNTSVAPGGAIGLTVYTVPGGFAGNEGNMGAWTQIGIDDGTGVSAGSNVPSSITLQTPAIIVPGTYGMALIGSGNGGAFNHSYTNGTGTNQNYSNTDYSLSLGAADNSPFAGGQFNPRVWNGEIHCTPGDGIFADFTGQPVSGPSSLVVQFMDATFTSDPMGVTSWDWDLDGDGNSDSTMQNPTFTYTTCGRYDVTLTASDNTNGSNTFTRTDYIVVDPLMLPAANFTATPLYGNCPLTVNFTDASTGSPTLWDWDLDGDGLTDSTIQNPTFTYNTPGCYTVTLTVTNACASGTETKTDFICCLANDDCAGALPLVTGMNGPYSTVGATTSAPAWPCALGGSDIWFTFTPVCNGTYDLTTCNAGATYDTCLELFDGSCTNLNPIACNDDSCGLQSLIQAPLVAGTTYYLRLGGFNGVSGSTGINVGRAGGTGSFTTAHGSCGSVSMTTNGNPDIGTTVTYSIAPAQGVGLIWIGALNLGTPLCTTPTTCTLGTTFNFIQVTETLTGTIPCQPLLVGATFYTQGADVGALGGCPSAVLGVPFELSATIATTVGS